VGWAGWKLLWRFLWQVRGLSRVRERWEAYSWAGEELKSGLEVRGLESKIKSRARWEGTKGAVNRDCASGSCGAPYRMSLT